MGGYAAPSVGPSGLSINSYPTILAYLVAGYQSIYGITTALGNDDADFQLISIVALLAADCNSALQLAYNQQSPATAIGAGLSTVVANNGLQRLISTFSTCQVTLTGTAGAVVTNGVVQNAATGDLWNLPATVTIGSGGTVTVTATAQASGAINALASQLTVINTPTSGWTSVTNGSNVANVGSPVETDSALRARQAVSTELPSLTPLAGTLAAVLAVEGVTEANILENTTGSTDGFGNPGHSITAVVAGGDDLDVATAIYIKRGLGVLMNGNSAGTVVTETVIDPNSNIAVTVNFNRPTPLPIYVICNAHLLTGGSEATIVALQAAIVNYLNSLGIGEVISFGELIAAAASANPNPAQPIVSIRSPFYFGITPEPTTSTDYTPTFYQQAQGITVNVVVNPV
jgi:Baseplate J-like protein